ncbi:hypothetical protein ADL22_21700 [Streptomyces sp. NRRL F-4489]|uniref:hypothetical protein n=1 Tax=Streptomyces sp. NRRL F-4489 TaxID=1609095 RepID=UPI00074873CB|nr:hypothetical protein [Streptomyces sp. NRRL F-4489]KUL37385.1 hypothetical protein ADL22_21700 [Streptomyces sp. NRRL F-4489]
MRDSNSPTDALGERDYPIEEKDLTEEQNEHRTTTLRAVRDNPNAPAALRDLAKKMLSGRVQLKDVLDDPAGHRALSEGLAPLREQWRAMSPQQRQAVRQYDPDEAPGSGGGPSGSRSPRS